MRKWILGGLLVSSVFSITAGVINPISNASYQSERHVIVDSATYIKQAN